ncbi:hypothetical protein BBF96_05620 [Anoxybacter fermentans]|uniref:Glycine radical enzyme activase n=1 Tax=Anoxybacter fermentans TaxID=1323375 RepID=A0A3Q9HPV4_9FIRM|nr:YjjW family glycine radical enzyme activase [Anoxybacter fermentans]AZR72914.1 hypothetical protein BBF96_05620 [Anoxybacter fermentans]
MSKLQALINRIIRFSAVDGPGNRLVIFLQGCNLQCINCHNPHTIGICNFCGKCIKECPVNALEIIAGDPSWINYDESRCVNCDHCLEVCPINSNPRSRWMEVDEVIKEIHRVAPFISGITVSGGEATQQLDFVKELFTCIKNDYKLSSLTNFIDSNGIAPISYWETLLPVLDGAMIDLKAFDPDVHYQLTGETNDLVLATIPYLYDKGKLYEVRLLIVPGYNDDREQIDATADYLAKIGRDIRIRLIPFRKHGVRAKFRNLLEPEGELMEEIKEIFVKDGFEEIYIT